MSQSILKFVSSATDNTFVEVIISRQRARVDFSAMANFAQDEAVAAQNPAHNAKVEPIIVAYLLICSKM